MRNPVPGKPAQAGRRPQALILSAVLLASLVLSSASAPAGSRAAVLPTGGRPAPRVFLGYWAKWGDNQRPAASLTQNMSGIDLFSPYWFTLRADGSLSSRESDRESITTTVQASGKKVIPLINKTSSDAPLLDASVRRRAVENVYRLLVDNGFDGVNIDFEGMPPSTRTGLTAFMTELEARLRPAGLLVTMAVPAKWSADESTNDFSAAFDYAALGRLVDYLVIMTYDQHAGWSGPGPVAGLAWTEDTIRYAVSVVPAGKILLGLAGYGYDWSSSGAVTEVEAWRAPGQADARGVSVEWDASSSSPHFTYWDASGARHDVWYESSWAVDPKIALVREYNLGGAALWALGQEETRFWEVIAGTAGRSGGLGAGAVSPEPRADENAASDGSGAGGGGGDSSGGGAGGKSDSTRPAEGINPDPEGPASYCHPQDVDRPRPDGPATSAPRADASAAEPSDLGQRSDLGSGGPALLWVDAVLQRLTGGSATAKTIAPGLAAGSDASGIGPEANPGLSGRSRSLSRAEFAVLLSGALSLPAPGTTAPSFSDVSSCDWYFDGVIRAAAAGYMSGVGANRFEPDRPLTEREAGLVATRAATVSASMAQTDGPASVDEAAVTRWAFACLLEMIRKGPLGGGGDETFRPESWPCRTEMAVLMGRLWP